MARCTILLAAAVLALLAPPAMAQRGWPTPGGNYVSGGALLVPKADGSHDGAGLPVLVPPSATDPLHVTGTLTPGGALGNNSDTDAAVSSGLSPVQSYPFLWNGATFDRWYGDKTNGAFVNVKTSALPTGAALDATLQSILTKLGSPSSTPVTGTFWQATQPVSIATAPVLVAGSAIIGKVGIDQTTPGTTNGVQVNAALPAGANGIGNVGGKTVSVCVTPTVTASNAYGTNYVVGGLLTFSNAFTATGTGILQSVAVTIKKVETSGFTFVPFTSNPSNTTWTDAAVAAINAADVAAVREPISLSAYSGLGTHTVASAVGIGQALAPGATSLYGVLIGNAALTNQFGSTSDVQVCVKVLDDL